MLLEWKWIHVPCFCSALFSGWCDRFISDLQKHTDAVWKAHRVRGKAVCSELQLLAVNDLLLLECLCFAVWMISRWSTLLASVQHLGVMETV